MLRTGDDEAAVRVGEAAIPSPIAFGPPASGGMLELVDGNRSGPQEKHLDEVRRIVFDKLGNLPAKVYLFGSAARRTAAATSDIDIAILPETPRAASRIPAIREALEESSVPFFVDVVNLSEAADTLLEAVLREGIRWTV